MYTFDKFQKYTNAAWKPLKYNAWNVSKISVLLKVKIIFKKGILLVSFFYFDLSSSHIKRNILSNQSISISTEERVPQ